MTRSVKQPRLLSIFVVALTLTTSVNAALQVDLKAGFLAGINDTNFYFDRTNNATLFSGNIYGTFDLTKSLSLILEENPDFLFALPDPVTDSINGQGLLEQGKYVTANAERRYSGMNNGYLGLKLNQAGNWEAGIRSIAYQNARHYDFITITDYYETDPSGIFMIKPEMRNTLSGSYLFQNDAFIANVSSNLFLNQSSIDEIMSDANNADSIVSSKKDLDLTLRTDFMAGMRLPQTGTLISAGALLQNHLGRAELFNIANYYAALSGDGDLFNNKFGYKIRSDIYNQDYLSDTLMATTGFFQTFYMRDSYTILDGLSLKGLTVMTLAKEVFKQRYEIAMRKAWQNESWFDLGYFSLRGVYFPEQGAYLRTMIRPVENVGIGLMGKEVWELPTENNDNKVQLLKSAINAELSFRITKIFEMYASGDYLHFNWKIADKFPNYYTLAIGTRAFLP